MINTNTVKAILAFYLKVRLTRWGVATDASMQLPTDEKKLDKIKLVCKLYYNLCQHAQDKKFLLAYCDELEKIEAAEKASHHSRYAPSLTDYPFMACTIRALRSHILNATSPESKISEIQPYLESEFINVIKYEDYHYTGGQYQQITSIKDFTECLKKDAVTLGLLDRIYLLNDRAKHPDREESAAAAKAAKEILNAYSSNYARSKAISTLFTEKAERKVKKIKEAKEVKTPASDMPSTKAAMH